MLPVPWAAAMLPVRITSPPLAVTVKVRATVFVLSQFATSPAMVVVPVPNEFVRVRVEPAVAVLADVKPEKVKPAPLRPVRVKLAELVPEP